MPSSTGQQSRPQVRRDFLSATTGTGEVGGVQSRVAASSNDLRPASPLRRCEPDDAARSSSDSRQRSRSTAAAGEGRTPVRGDGRKGNYAAHTGPQATPWAGNKGGKFCTAQGNILAGEAVVTDMVDAFEKTTGHLSLRLMAALDAGQAAGGDKRGKQSAAMLIVKKDGGVWLHNDVVLRLQVDDNPEPLKELRRLVEMNARRFRAR